MRLGRGSTGRLGVGFAVDMERFGLVLTIRDVDLRFGSVACVCSIGWWATNHILLLHLAEHTGKMADGNTLFAIEVTFAHRRARSAISRTRRPWMKRISRIL